MAQAMSIAIINPTIPVLSFSPLSISFFTSPAMKKKQRQIKGTTKTISHIHVAINSNVLIRQLLKR